MIQNFILNNGNLLLKTGPLGQETAYAHDGMGHLVNVVRACVITCHTAPAFVDGLSGRPIAQLFSESVQKRVL
jgi:YD repeat-containing protein